MGKKMDIGNNEDRLLKAMYDHEAAISQLYGVYADRFSDYKDFWLGLSEDEKEHASCLAFLREKVKEESEFIVVERFPIEALDTSIHYVQKLIDRAGETDFELINALSMAVHLEEAMIENRYFEVFQGDSAQVVRVMHLLSDETRKHSQKVKAALEQYKQTGV